MDQSPLTIECPPMDAQAAADLTIIGAGLHSYRHLTVEACSVIAAARVVFTYGNDPSLVAFLRKLNADTRLTDTGVYQPGAFRPAWYHRIAQRVVDEAGHEPGVVLLECGSAVVTDWVTQLILYRARRAGLSLRIVPGISCIETVLAGLGFDPSGGLQVFQAQKLLLQEGILDPACAVLLIQPGGYDTLWWGGLPRSRAERYDRLTAYLRRFYPPDAQMCLIQTPSALPDGMVPPFWFRLENLNLLHDAIAPHDSLFIPPHRVGPLNGEFDRAIGSWAQLAMHLELSDRGWPEQREGHYARRRDLRGVPPEVVEEAGRICAAREGLAGASAEAYLRSVMLCALRSEEELCGAGHDRPAQAAHPA